ncbi:glycosyltransferase [Pedobacter rhizosphaerae]|uniref:Glycosyltransferase involved in cell wall bisynthesis n=1 Tax=Pedobacter rhizosphaerae TaxID=390241 RepID=A0A1H9V3R1_9SPHI|nr:glycosyltransferase [Pedobacter rhizosphaerae]SES16312.1 Glycosyltransferase involved in cell wall bisynthesis [Pedobacter rhizosphaerae]
MEQPLISIALCTYNGSRFVEEQLISIINQTYRNIEIIVVDDGSKDETVEVVRTLMNSFPQIKLFENESNLGFNKNFQRAIELATGAYIAISDQDDIWELNKLELLFNHIGDKWLIFSNSAYINEENEHIDKMLLDPSFHLGDRDFRSLLFYNFVTGHTTLFDRKLISYALPIPQLGYYDWWMGFVALYHHKITYLNKCLTLHRIHTNSVMQKEELNNAKNLKEARYSEIANNLSTLKEYKGLSKKDRRLISRLFLSYTHKSKYNLFLITQMIKDYHKFFPDLKKRNLISRFNFARKMGY